MVKAKDIAKKRRIIERKKRLKQLINKLFIMSEKNKKKVRNVSIKTAITLASFSPVIFSSSSSGAPVDRKSHAKHVVDPQTAKMQAYADSMEIDTEVGNFVKDYTENNLHALSSAPSQLKDSVNKAFANTIDFREAEKNDAKLTVVLDKDQKTVVYASIIQDGEKSSVYRFVDEKGEVDYYNEQGQRVRDIIDVKPVDGVFRSKFGYRMHPIHKTRKLHTGIDYSAPRNTEIQAAADGYIRYMGDKEGYGKLIIVQHANGYETYYAHLNKYPNFKDNERDGKKILVKKGDLVGYVGNTGTSVNNHLHFEVRKDSRPVDPFKEIYYTGDVLSQKDELAFNKQVGTFHMRYPEALKQEELLALADTPDKLEKKVRADIRGKDNMEVLNYLYKYRADRASFVDNSNLLSQATFNWQAVSNTQHLDVIKTMHKRKTKG